MKQVAIVVVFFLTACLPVENPIETLASTVEIDTNEQDQQEISCSPVLPNRGFEPPNDFQEAISFLKDYLNSGGDPYALDASMQSESLHVEFGLQEIDLSSNIESEILIEIGFFRENNYPVERGWALFYCQKDEYVSEIVSWTSGPFSGASIFEVLDVNEDGTQEVIFKTVTGGSFSRNGLKVIGFIDGTYVQFIDDPNPVACPSEYELFEGELGVGIKMIGVPKLIDSQDSSLRLEIIYELTSDSLYSIVSAKLVP